MKLLYRILLVIIVLIIVFLAGPETAIDTKIEPLTIPENPEEYILNTESANPDIRQDAEKMISWYGEKNTKTEYSLVYIHGYTASRKEIWPVMDSVAASLGANLFYTRLRGHGRSPEAMGEAKAGDWLTDAVEALEIGKRLGEKVIVTGTSTGGTLASWLACSDYRNYIYKTVLISPNYGPADKNAELANLPWAPVLLPALFGKTIQSEPESPGDSLYWTHNYPIDAVFQMMKLVQHVRDQDYDKWQSPVLFIYSEKDQTVDPSITDEIYAKIPGNKRRIIVETSGHKDMHVLAGNLKSPENNAMVSAAMLTFIREDR